ncbi:MATE family efflux transporter [Tamilnaduibacter salinus]|nr:MATE family efflux transporter [Tamilnaduibacter salinus]
MAWPMLIGVLSLMSFQLIDSIFIGQLGRDPLAAQGFTVPMQQLIIGLQVGLGIATTAIISRTLGAGNTDRARRLGGLVVLLGGALVFVVLALIWALRQTILDWLGAEPSLVPLVSSYWLVWLGAAWLGAVLYFGYSLSRSHGDTRLPGFLMVLTSLINIGLDPLYIFVFGWGLPGAAFATVTAFGTGCLIVYPALLKRGWLHFGLGDLRLFRAVRELFGIMAPAMTSQLMPPLAASLATAIVAGFGSAAVGAWGLGTRLEFFSIVVVLALTMAMPPMIGHMLGAGHLQRVRELIRIGVRFVIVWQLAIGLIWLALSGIVSEIFTADPSVTSILHDYLLRVPLSYSGLGVCMLMVSVCNALGLPMRALLISVLRLFACYLPSLWLGSRIAGIPGLLTGALIGNLLAGVQAYLLYRWGMGRLQAQNISPRKPRRINH